MLEKRINRVRLPPTPPTRRPARTVSPFNPGVHSSGRPHCAVVPEGTRATPCEVAGRPAEWVEGPDADTSRVLLYFHGGGYVLGSASHLFFNI